MPRPIGRRRVLGRDLKVGDTIEVWWSPRRDTILSLRPYTGRLTCFKAGAKLAEFALNQTGMTIENDHYSISTSSPEDDLSRTKRLKGR